MGLEAGGLVPLPGLRRTRQPGQRTGLDFAHPLVRGLVFSALNSAQDASLPPLNLVNNKAGTGTKTGVKADEQGLSASFDGTSQYHLHGVDLSAYSRMTFAVTFNAATYGPNSLLGYGPQTSDGTTYFGLGPGSAGGGILLYKGVGSYSIQRFTRPSAGVWRTILFQVDTTTSATFKNFWLDGVVMSPYTQSNGSTGLWANSVLSICTGTAAAGFSAYAVRNVQIWNRWLSNAEITQYTDRPSIILLPPKQYLGGAVETQAPLLVPSTRLTRQPAQRPVLDRAHPLAQGLLFSAFNSAADGAGPPINYVTGAVGSRVGKAVQVDGMGVTPLFNGSPDYAAIPCDLSGQNKITLSYWHWAPSYPNDGAALISHGGVFFSSGANGFVVAPDDSASSSYIAGPCGASSYALNGFARPAAGAWHHIVWGFDRSLGASSVVFSMVDGVVQTMTHPASNGTVGGNFLNTPLYLGSAYGGSGTFCNARFRNVNIHSGILSPQRAIELYRNAHQMFMPAKKWFQPSVVKADRSAQAFIPRRFTRQPAQRPALDRGHPLAQGLVHSWLNCAQDMRTAPVDYVTGRVGGKVGCTFVADVTGLSMKTPGATTDNFTAVVSLQAFKRATITARFWVDSYANGDRQGLCTAVTTGTGGFVFNFDQAAGYLGFGVFQDGGSGNYHFARITRPSTGAWHTASLVIDRTQAGTAVVQAVVLDGVLQSPSFGSVGSVAANSSFGADQTMYFMSNGSSSYAKAGQLQCVNIHGRALSVAEIQSLHANPYQMFLPHAPARYAATLTTNLAGPYQLAGTLVAATIPIVGGIVRLYEELTGLLLRETTTDGDGAWFFGSKGDELDQNKVYTAIGYDAITGYQYNGAIKRGLVPGHEILV